MTSYTPIPDSDIDPESPGTTTLFTRLRDNAIAMFEKASGAPRLAAGYVENSMLQPPSAGTGYLIRRITEYGGLTNATSYLDAGYNDRYDEGSHLGCTCLVAGVITAYAEHRAGGGDGVSHLRVLKNGVLVQEWTTSSTGFIARQVNIAVSVGDAIIFQHYNSGSNLSAWQHLRIYSNNPNFAVT